MKKGADTYGRNIFVPLLMKMTFLIQKMTNQDKETIDKRAKDVPESDKTVCRETELVRGF